jgi:hypothetical protein
LSNGDAEEEQLENYESCEESSEVKRLG